VVQWRRKLLNDKAIEISPFEDNHYYYRGLAWYKKGNRERAVKDFDKAIMLNSRSSTYYNYRGICMMEEGKYREALSDYKNCRNNGLDCKENHQFLSTPS